MGRTKKRMNPKIVNHINRNFNEFFIKAAIKASIPGYKTIIKSNIEVAENTTIEVDFNLVESTEPAEEEGGMAEYCKRSNQRR